MKKRLIFRMVIAYIIFFFLGFVVISTFTSNFNQKKLEEEMASSLQKESYTIATSFAKNYFSSDITLEDFQSQLNALGEYLNADIYIVATSGDILIESSDSSPSEEHKKIEGFNILDFGNNYYSIGRFYDRYDEDIICVYTSVTRNYQVISYVIVCQPLIQTTILKNNLLNGSYISLLILMIFSLIILLVFILSVYRPINKIIKAAASYAKGDFDLAVDLHSKDEIGYIADTMNYMAMELNSLENDQHKFISNISHDFRSPLTSITGYAQAMVDGTIPPKAQEKYLNVIIFEAERLENLTQNLLELNKLDSKGMFLDISVFDLNRLLKQTVLAFEGLSKDKMLTFELILTNERLFVKADEQKIERVIHNLIDNAIKFSNKNSSIIIETTTRGGKVFVSVKDFGIGIPKESIMKIWERFYKTDVSRGKDKKGAGLGLAIVKEIINAHNENINVISTQDVGTEFIFTLTLASDTEIEQIINNKNED